MADQRPQPGTLVIPISSEVALVETNKTGKCSFGFTTMVPKTILSTPSWLNKWPHFWGERKPILTFYLPGQSHCAFSCKNRTETLKMEWEKAEGEQQPVHLATQHGGGGSLKCLEREIVVSLGYQETGLRFCAGLSTFMAIVKMGCPSESAKALQFTVWIRESTRGSLKHPGMLSTP